MIDDRKHRCCCCFRKFKSFEALERHLKKCELHNADEKIRKPKEVSIHV